jgi:arginyl-tRNA synthetase
MQPAEEEEEPKDCQEKRFTMQKTEDARSTLLRLLARYPEVVDATLHSAEPNTMMTYLTNITTSLSSAVPNRSDLRPENDEQRQLFHAARVVLQNALGLLGISPR